MASNLSNNRISKINLGNVDYHIKSIPFGATEQEWAEKDYIPSERELIVVDDNNLKFKLGNGQDKVADLPYVLDGYATEEYVENLYTKLNSNTVLGFYCIEDVTIVTNGISKVYPANSNVEVSFIEGDTFEIIPTSDKSILQLNAFPGALGTFYPWLEGVRQFSNILFDMNNVEFYSKWSQGNQGAYQVQFAQYSNCIFWSDNAYVKDVNKRTNYTLYYTSQLPLCYSNIPDNTFKAFFLAFGVNNDPNWGNPVYRESFSKATWPTQAFSYYGARTIGIFGHDSDLFNIVLPKDCRGLMCESTAIENAGTFDAINVTDFGAKSGSWRDAFRMCYSLRNLYIKNLKVSLNISWSPVEYDSISFIIETAANTNPITISVSPYTYYLLKESDFELAASKNITIELFTTNYQEDTRLSSIANKADITYVDESIANLVNSAPETLDTLGELATAFSENKEVVDTLNAAIGDKANRSEVPTNLVNGSATGSIRGISTTAESADYTIGENAFAIGNGTKASGKNSFASGQDTAASGSYSHVEGYGCTATAAATHAEGYDTHATARYAHAEGASTTASGNNSHAEGNSTTSSGHYSHAEGNFTTAAGGYSHAEGNYCQTGEDATYAHAEGSYAKALATGAHAEGNHVEANGVFSHAEGTYTIADSLSQHVQGKYNIADADGVYAHIVGNGQGDGEYRANAHTLDWEGNAWFSGDVYIGSTSGVNKDEGSKKLATEEYVDNNKVDCSVENGVLIIK